MIYECPALQCAHVEQVPFMSTVPLTVLEVSYVLVASALAIQLLRLFCIAIARSVLYTPFDFDGL